MFLCMLPATALAYTAPDSTVYNDHDYYALKTFLDAISTDGVTTNGVKACGADYSEDPATWDGVTWTNVGGELRVSEITWQDASLNGDLDLSGCTSLEYIDVMSFFSSADNSIDSIDVSGCSALTALYCRNNPITELDLTDLAALEVLDCAYCYSLTSLTITGCSSLRILCCDYCPVGPLTFGTAFPNLERLMCDYSGQTSLDLSGCPRMTRITCEGNALTSLNVDGLTNLVDLICGESPGLGTLDISDLTSLVQLSCWDCGLSSLEIASTSLRYLCCSENNLTELDVSGLTKLEDLYCDGNNLTELDVSDCAALRYFNCSENSISSLDLSHSPLLEMLFCSDNQLTALDTTASGKLELLGCTGNPLASVNTILEGESIVLNANGSGYVGLVYDEYEKEYYIEATANAGTFMDWTNAAGDLFSNTAITDILPETPYDLTANFLTLTPSEADGTIYTGGRITLTPNIPGGIWDFDAEYLSQNGSQFRGLSAGTTRVTYTVNGTSVYFDVIILDSGLPSTGQDGTLMYIFAASAVLLAVGAIMVLINGRKCKQVKQ